MNSKNKKQKKYDKFKAFKGTRYSGMKIGASHKWYYDQGEWRERKITPDEWEIYYQTTKRRAGHAPEGTGAPVGTEYNWLIVAHQRVDKLDANSYTTKLDGKKFKVAHKRAAKNKWSISERTQRKKVIQYLEQVIRELKEADEEALVPYTVGDVDRIYGLEHRNMTELREMASELNISGRSKMDREALQEAIRAAKNELRLRPETLDEVPEELVSKSKEELYRIAGDKLIKGRSGMKKEELIEVLEKELETVKPGPDSDLKSWKSASGPSQRDKSGRVDYLFSVSNNSSNLSSVDFIPSCIPMLRTASRSVSEA